MSGNAFYGVVAMSQYQTDITKSIFEGEKK